MLHIIKKDLTTRIWLGFSVYGAKHLQNPHEVHEILCIAYILNPASCSLKRSAE